MIIRDISVWLPIKRMWIVLSLTLALVAIGRCEEAIPFLSYQELKALSPDSSLGCNFDWPKLKSIPDQEKLIAQCQKDFSESGYFERFKKQYKLSPNISDKLRLSVIVKGQKNKIIYFVFDLETEMINDFCVVYYYSPDLHKFILKSQS